MINNPQPTDEELLSRLRVIARTVDPAPASVSEFARAAFAFRDLDSELATLVADSALEASALRAPTLDTRLVEFATEGLEIDIQISSADRSSTMIGQLRPPAVAAGAAVVIESTSGERTAEVLVDEDARFEVTGVPTGSIRLRCRWPGSPAVVTPWIS